MAFLKEVNVPENARRTAYAAAAMEVGEWVKLNGEFSAGDITTLGSDNSNKPGYASIGDMKVTSLTTSDDHLTGRVGVVGKKIYVPEDADTEYDDIAKGQSCIVYVAGQFETDMYVSVSGTGGAFGDYLKVNDDAKLIEESSATTETSKSVARVIRVNNGDRGGDTTKDSLIFEIL